MHADPDARLPVTVLTGFLGAGKTTLLNRLLADPALRETAVVINEVGSVGLDHLLVEHATDGVVLLGGGCLCCALRGDLADTLLDLARRREEGSLPRFRRIVVETTGLADPAPVLQTLVVHPGLAALYRLAGVVTVVDAVNGPSTLDRHAEAVKQVALADRLVVGKRDLARQADLEALGTRLQALNPGAPRLDAQATGADLLLDLDGSTQTGVSSSLSSWLSSWLAAERYPASRHRWSADDGGIRSFALTADRPLSPAALEEFLDLVRARHGPNLLRMKALVALTDRPEQPVVVHAVQHVLHPPRRLPGWPDADRRSRLVFVLRDADPEDVERLFAAFSGRPGIDMPDRQALSDNPLAL